MSLKLHTMTFDGYSSPVPRERFVLLARTLGIPTFLNTTSRAGTLTDRVELWCHDVQWEMLLDVFRPYANEDCWEDWEDIS